jgi:hypothetical protein
MRLFSEKDKEKVKEVYTVKNYKKTASCLCLQDFIFTSCMSGAGHHAQIHPRGPAFTRCQQARARAGRVQLRQAQRPGGM